MKTKLTFLVGALAAIAGANVTVSDQQSFLNEWELFVGGGTNVGTASASRAVGQGHNGTDARVVTIFPAASGQMTYEVYNIFTPRWFDPKNDGVCTQINWLVWCKVPSFMERQDCRIALRQGPSVYLSSAFWEFQDYNSSWHPASDQKPASQFPLYKGPGPSTLTFNVDSPKIEIGYLTYWGGFFNGPMTNWNSDISVTFVAVPPTPPTSLAVNIGTVQSGTVTNLGRFDGNGVIACKGFQPNVSSPFVSATVEATSATSSPTSIEFRTGTQMLSTGQYQQSIQLFDFQAGDWDTPKTDPLGTAQLLTSVAGTGNLSRYVGPGNKVRARVQVKVNGFGAVAVPCVKLDATVFQIMG